MRISDWSSDVCSSDLSASAVQDPLLDLVLAYIGVRDAFVDAPSCVQIVDRHSVYPRHPVDAVFDLLLVVRDECLVHEEQIVRSEERSVGTECVSTCRSRG